MAERKRSRLKTAIGKRTIEFARLRTEKQNAASANLDTMSALNIVRLMNREDAVVATAVRYVLPRIAKAIDIAAENLVRGGRLIYVGTGTSGRIGALDSSECPPTFSTGPRMIQYVIAGGNRALGQAVEGKEDDPKLGHRDMAHKRPTEKDVVVGIASSGRTPYTIAAIEYARSKGAKTIAIVCNRRSALARAADLAIEVDVGPEILTGSTRLKAGTAQKMICNMLTTGAMARQGYVYGNLMVNVRTTSQKLTNRAIKILQITTGMDRDSALTALEAAGMKVPVALVMVEAGVGRKEAIERLAQTNGNVRRAIEGQHFLH